MQIFQKWKRSKKFEHTVWVGKLQDLIYISSSNQTFRSQIQSLGRFLIKYVHKKIKSKIFFSTFFFVCKINPYSGTWKLSQYRWLIRSVFFTPNMPLNKQFYNKKSWYGFKPSYDRLAPDYFSTNICFPFPVPKTFHFQNKGAIGYAYLVLGRVCSILSRDDNTRSWWSPLLWFANH